MALPALPEVCVSEPRRFIISSVDIADGYLTCTGSLHHHLKVLRLQPGSKLLLLDEHGTTHQGIISEISREKTVISLLAVEKTMPAKSTVPAISVLQGIPKGDKAEFILQKSTELGVTNLHLFQANRSVVQIGQAKLEKRLERWQKIISEAARQSERFDLPSVQWHPCAADAINKAGGCELKLLLWERGESLPLREKLSAMPKPASIALAVGPEGGFTKDETELFLADGFLPITLGKRILRTETTAIVMAGVIQYLWGDF
jgi:16S rRNA (uracil1498-N3)-methyltransferase